jgi:hypothetical protein
LGSVWPRGTRRGRSDDGRQGDASGAENGRELPRNVLLRANQMLGHGDRNVVWLPGDGRSGRAIHSRWPCPSKIQRMAVDVRSGRPPAATEAARGRLEPSEDRFKSVRAKDSNVLNQSLIWSVINLAPLRQCSAEALNACFYESISERPRQELERPSRRLGGAGKLEALTESPVTRPSLVDGR